jgi:hypothetical protein
MQRYMPVILALRLRQKDGEFEASLGYIDLVLNKLHYVDQKKPDK